MELLSPTGSLKIRSDNWGSGHYGASRDVGSRSHAGVDLLVKFSGQAVFMPCDGYIVRYARPYADDLLWSGVLIETKTRTIKIFYFVPDYTRIGQRVLEGAVIGVAQDIGLRYSSAEAGKMTPHLHLEVADFSIGKTIDPFPLLKKIDMAYV